MTDQIIQVLEKTSDDHDTDDMRFYLNEVKEKNFVGFGYRTKDTGQINLIRCPKCRKENYAPAVATGNCAWCGFTANL